MDYFLTDLEIYADCLLALDQYLQSRSEADQAALGAAYEAIPAHLRRYAPGDMDAKDWPLRVLCAGIGGTLDYPAGTAKTGTPTVARAATGWGGCLNWSGPRSPLSE